MIIRRLSECKKFISGDHATLRELLHAAKDNFRFRYSLAHAVVKAGKSTKPHKLRTCEVYYILKGRGVMHVGDEISKVKSKCAIYIPPHSVQYIKNIGKSDLIFLCIVDPAWRKEDEEIIEDNDYKKQLL